MRVGFRIYFGAEGGDMEMQVHFAAADCIGSIPFRLRGSFARFGLSCTFVHEISNGSRTLDEGSLSLQENAGTHRTRSATAMGMHVRNAIQ